MITMRSINAKHLLLARFLVVGVLNTLFGLAVYTGLIMLGLPISVGIIGGNIAGIFFNFVTTGHLVFLDATLARFPRFVLAYLLLFCCNYALLRVLMMAGLGKIVGQIVVTPVMALLSFYLMSSFVFPARKDVAE
jgi:putative flippase GtrA